MPTSTELHLTSVNKTLEIMESTHVLPKCRLRISEKSSIPSTLRILNNLSPTINLLTTSQFELKIRGESFRSPVYYGEGSRKFNIAYKVKTPMEFFKS
jgi:hypothetical protein